MKKKLKFSMLFVAIVFLSSCEKYSICGCTYIATGLAVEAHIMEKGQFGTTKQNKKTCSKLQDFLNTGIINNNDKVACELK